MHLEKALGMLTPEQREDAGNRDMLYSVRSIKAYLEEIVEVEKASKIMKKIYLEISNMTSKQQRTRLKRIEAQRKAFNEAVYSIENEQLL